MSKYEVSISTDEHNYSLNLKQQGSDFVHNPKSELDNIIDRFVVKEALNQLKDKERQIVLLYSISGLKHREIADLMNIPRATERWCYMCAIGKLKRLLNK